jgi:PST family polysaccharide transporter
MIFEKRPSWDFSNLKNNDSEDHISVSDVKAKVIKSVKWTALSDLFYRSIRPVVTLILAGILLPADFGVVGIAMVAIGLAQIFQDFGFGKALIQRETDIDKSANVIFWTNVGLSIFLYLILFLTAPLIAGFFQEHRVISVLRVLCLQLVFSSLFLVHRVMLQREFQFKQLFYINLFSAIIPNIVAIVLAIQGYGVWALVFRALVGSVNEAVLFWRLCPWRPKLNYDYQLAKQLLGFSKWVMLEGLMVWLIVWGDSVILGHFLGVKELGIYRVGGAFTFFVFGIFLNFWMPITYLTFSRLQSDIYELKQVFLKITTVLASVCIPIGVGLAILAQPISSLMFGQKWNGLGIVIMIISMREAISWLTTPSPELYKALGQPGKSFKLHLIEAVCYVPVFIIAAPYGLNVFCFAGLALAIMACLLHVFVTHRILQMPLTYIWHCTKVSLVAVVPMLIAGYIIHISCSNFFQRYLVFLEFAILMSVYGITLWIVKKDFLQYMLKTAIKIGQ